QLISMHDVADRGDMEAYISRVGQFRRALGEMTDRAEANAARGVRPPYFAYDFVIAESKRLIEGAPFTDGEDSALWADGKTKIAALVTAGTIDEAAADELRSGLETALKESYLPAYQRLIAFMERDRFNVPEIATGIGGLPDGPAYYADLLRMSTTTELSAEEIHQIGLDEVQRIHRAMEAIKASAGFEGDLAAFFVHV